MPSIHISPLNVFCDIKVYSITMHVCFYSRSHEDDAEYYKIPSLGKHYSHKWAQEDMIEEQREGKDFTQQRSYLASKN